MLINSELFMPRVCSHGTESKAIDPGLYSIKGVTRWAKSSGNTTMIINEWQSYDYGCRFSSLDVEVGLHRSQMQHSPDGAVYPAAFKFMVHSEKQALSMKLSNGDVHSGGKFWMWIHMPGSSEHQNLGTGVSLWNKGAYCKVSAALDPAGGWTEPDKTFDMVFFSLEMNTSFVLNEDDAIVIVTDVMKKDDKITLVVDYVKKITHRDSAAVHAHVTQYFSAVWKEGQYKDRDPVLQREELTDPTSAKRAASFKVAESPVVNKKQRIKASAGA